MSDGGRSYAELGAWKNGMALAVAVYEATRSWPAEERFGLTSQIRRAVVSISSNIAEGQGRNGQREVLNHLSIAHGSLCEVETQLTIAQHLGYLNDSQLTRLLGLCQDTGNPLRGLIRHLIRHLRKAE